MILILTSPVRDADARSRSDAVAAGYALRIGRGTFLSPGLPRQAVEDLCDELAEAVRNDTGSVVVCSLCPRCEGNMRWLQGGQAVPVATTVTKSTGEEDT